MLVISRKKNEAIVINDDTTVTIIEIRDDKVRLGITVPKEVPVHRQEVHEALLSSKPRNSTPAPSQNLNFEIARLQKELTKAQKQIKQYRHILQHYLQEEWHSVDKDEIEKALEKGSTLETIIAELEQGTRA